MSKRRVLTSEQILIAYKLKELGFSNRQIAQLLDTAKTTIWVNVYKKKETTETQYRNLHIVINIVQSKKKEGKTSLETAQELQLPLEEVNYIWTHRLASV